MLRDIAKLIQTVIPAVLLFLLPPHINAQSTLGTITGTVVDASGAVVPGASVEVKNQGTEYGRTVTTNRFGDYDVTHLLPGVYAVLVQAAGFQIQEQRDIHVEALRTVRINVTLAVLTSGTKVSVSTTVPVVETEGAVISSVRTSKHLNDMPLNLRTFDSRTGGSGIWGYTFVTPTGAARGVTMSLGGGRTTMIDFNIDGITTKNPRTNGTQPSMPSLESVGEVRFEYVNNKAEFGELANVSVVTKSGENAFHGRVLWDVRNRVLNARNFFSPATQKANRHDFGGTASGPIIRNKLFFTATYEGQIEKLEGLINASVPTLKMRRGDFSDLSTAVRDPFTSAPFADKAIPQSMIYSGSTAWQDRVFPLPNFGAANSASSNFRINPPQQFHQRHIDTRVDYIAASNNTIYGRVGFQGTDPDFVEGPLVPTYSYRDETRHNWNAVLADTWVVSPRSINEFKIGYSRNYDRLLGPAAGQELVDLMGIQGLQKQAPDVRNVPSVSITGFYALTQSNNVTQADQVVQISDQFTLIKGRHTLKVGADYRPQRAGQTTGPTFGSYAFQNRFTGYSYADFLVGLPLTTARGNADDPKLGLLYYANGFAQDDYKISAKLTLSVGLRYEFNSPPVDKYDKVYNFDPATGSLVVPNQEALGKANPLFPAQIPVIVASQAGLPERSLRQADKSNFLPRFGFAYRPFGGTRTVIRGGYGVYNNALTAQLFQRYYGGPFSGSESYTNVITKGVPLLTLQLPFTAQGTPSLKVGSVAVNATARRLINPYAQQWNFTIERELGFQLGLRASYVGTKSTQLLYTRNLNQPVSSTVPFSQNRQSYPLYQNIQFVENGAGHIYHALSIEAERKWSRGLYFQAAWTLAKSLTDVDEWRGVSETGVAIVNSYNRAAERGNSQFFARQRLIASAIWQLPVGKGRALLSQGGIFDKIVGGWQISGTFLAQTGQFLSPTFSGSDPSNTNTIGGWPDRIGDGNLPVGQRSIGRWFETTAFAVPPNGRFGNSGTGIIEGPGLQTLSAALFKDFSLVERVKFRLQMGFTNVLNHPNFGLPDMNISAPNTAGIISATEGQGFGGPRVGHVGVRIEF